LKKHGIGYKSSFSPFIASGTLISEELIRIERVNRDGYILHTIRASLIAK